MFIHNATKPSRTKYNEVIWRYPFWCLMFALFVHCRFISRLYYFPLKVLYACSTVLLSREFYPEYTLLIVSMLLLLTAMNVFWFSQMLVFLYKIFTGELREVDDIREYDVVEKLERFVRVWTICICKFHNRNDFSHLLCRCRRTICWESRN